MHVQVASECGPDFPAALAARLDGLGVTFGPIDGTAADAVVVGGRDCAADLDRALAAGTRWIQTLTAGVDRVLTPAVVASGLPVTTGAAATARPVSEFAMARVLEHAKQLRALDAQQRARSWSPRWLDALAGSTMTVVGLGPVGARVARLAEAFEVHVIGVRRDPSRPAAGCAEVVGPGALTAAMARSDATVLAPALTPETVGMVGAAELASAKPGMLLVNVGRGELVDHQALVAAVREGRVVAALDVTPEEPLPADSELWDVDGIAVSPHTATLTAPLIGWLADAVAANVRRFLAGEPLHDQVDVEAGYPTR
jgi:phosphoglycerate dehydrogenase-like enzyme